MPLGNEDTMLTLNELSEETGVSSRTIRNWIEIGLVPHAKGRANTGGNYTAEHVQAVLTAKRHRRKQQSLRDMAKESRIVQLPTKPESEVFRSQQQRTGPDMD